MENKKEEKNNDLRYSQACITLRKHLNMPDLDENSRRIPCNEGRFCYQEGCPIFVKPKVEPKEEPKNERTWYCAVCGVTVSGDVSAHTKTKFHQVNLNKKEGYYSYPLYCPETLVVCKRDKCAIYKNCRYKTKHSKEEPKDLGQGFKSDGTRHIPANLKDDVNVTVFEEIDEKPKKKKKEMSVHEFLNIQMRVLEKLSWHPEIYEALDNLPSTEILDRLLGKTGLEGVATHVGGDMKLKASTKTKQLFENLEKQFAEEDEKKGKGAPPNYETVGHLPADTGFKMTWVDPDDERFFREEKKEEKKNGKKSKK